MPVIDVLTVFPVPTFVADNTQKQIFINLGGGGTGEFRNSEGASNFKDGDNVFLKNIRITLPYQYGIGDLLLNPYINIVYFQNGIEKKIPEISAFLATGGIHLNPNCGDTDINILLEAPDPGQGAFKIRLEDYLIPISQINGPTILNGDTLRFNYQMEVIHTLEMS